MSRSLQTTSGMIPLSTDAVSTGDYQRPSDWLEMPVLSDTDEKIVMLAAVYDHSSNFVAFKCTGDYFVDWGDGSEIESVSSGVTAERILDYSDFSGTETSLGYRQAMIVITPQTQGGLITALLSEKHSLATSSYQSATIDASASCTSLTSISFKGNADSSSLKIFSLGSSSISNASSMFYSCTSLELVEMASLSNIENTSSMFYECYSIRLIPMLDLSNTSVANSMFFRCYSLESVPQFNMPVATSANNMFYQCYSLKSVQLLGLSNLTTAINMFLSCRSLKTVLEMNLLSISISGISNIFNGCTTLSRSIILNLSANVSYSSCNLSSAELNEIFTNLSTVTDSQTITITGNWGADTCDTTIATAKGWTVVN